MCDASHFRSFDLDAIMEQKENTEYTQDAECGCITFRVFATRFIYVASNGFLRRFELCSLIHREIDFYQDRHV